MKNGLKFIDIINETETHEQARIDTSIALLYKGLQHLLYAVRDIESAMQYMDDQEKKDKIEDFKQSLIDDFGVQFSKFDSDQYDGHDHLINRITKFIDDNSENNWNFNLNGDPTDRAPKGSA
jgi:hypothetical protein